jgi:hypothetical protein
MLSILPHKGQQVRWLQSGELYRTKIRAPGFHLQLMLPVALAVIAQPPVAVADDKAAEQQDDKDGQAKEDEGEVLGRLSAWEANEASGRPSCTHLIPCQ